MSAQTGWTIAISELWTKVRRDGPALSFLTKILAAPLVAAAWLLAANLVISGLGTSGYATYAIIAGIAVLLPFADLGMGAAVMDAMARRSDPKVDAVDLVMVTTLRALSLVGLLIGVVGVAFASAGWWAPALGLAPSKATEQAVALALCVFGIGLPATVGPRLLTGGGLNHWSVGFQALSAVLMLTTVVVASRTAATIESYAVSPFLAALICNLAALVVAVRKFDLPLLDILANVPRRRFRGTKVRGIAGPMLIITIVLPLAYQTDRLVLSHLQSLDQVASYSLGFQIYSPILGLVGSAGISLWPIFARSRNSAGRIPRKGFLQYQLVFGAVGAVLAAALIGFTPVLSRVVGGDSVEVPTTLTLAFAGLLLVQAVSYPLAMALTDEASLRFQAKLHLLMLAANLPLSLWLATLLGPAGPVLASLLAICLTLIIPQAVRVRRSILTAPHTSKEDHSAVQPR